MLSLLVKTQVAVNVRLAQSIIQKIKNLKQINLKKNRQLG